jgi:hypothetical protein
VAARRAGCWRQALTYWPAFPVAGRLARLGWTCIGSPSILRAPSSGLRRPGGFQDRKICRQDHRSRLNATVSAHGACNRAGGEAMMRADADGSLISMMLAVPDAATTPPGRDG